jgi:hypothetical protein
VTTSDNQLLEPVRRRLPTWAKVLIAVGSVLVLAPLAAAAVFVWSFSGGWDGIRPQPEADDRRVVQAREASGAELDRLTAATVGLLGAPELARARTDECQVGQNNWKVHEGYKLRCERTDVVVLAAPSNDVALIAQDVDARLRAGALVPSYDGGGLWEPGEEGGGLRTTGGTVAADGRYRPAEASSDEGTGTVTVSVRTGTGSVDRTTIHSARASTPPSRETPTRAGSAGRTRPGADRRQTHYRYFDD